MIRSVALFLAWAIVGFIGSFSLLYGFTPIGPVILLVIWLGYRFLPRIDGRRAPEAFGALAGLGAFWLFVASTVDGDSASIALPGALALTAAITCYLVTGRRRCARRVAPG